MQITNNQNGVNFGSVYKMRIHCNGKQLDSQSLGFGQVLNRTYQQLSSALVRQDTAKQKYTKIMQPFSMFDSEYNVAIKGGKYSMLGLDNPDADVIKNGQKYFKLITNLRKRSPHFVTGKDAKLLDMFEHQSDIARSMRLIEGRAEWDRKHVAASRRMRSQWEKDPNKKYLDVFISGDETNPHGLATKGFKIDRVEFNGN